MNRPSTHPATNELAEATIAHTLHALAHTAAPAGMHERILRNAQLRVAAQHETAMKRLRWPQLLRWGIPAACAATIVAVVLVRSHPNRTTAVLPYAGRLVQNDLAPGNMPEHATVPVVATHHAEAHLRTASPEQPFAVAAAIAPTDAPIDYERRAIENTEAPSQAAAPLPLTAQEQRFLHLVQSHDTADLAEVAELDPNIRAMREALDRDAFERFFAPPTAVTATQNPPSTHSYNGGNQ